MEYNLTVNAPPHYVEGRNIFPIDVIESWKLFHHEACALKYIARYNRKGNGFQDLQKAVWYLERFTKTLKERVLESELSIVSYDPVYIPDLISKDWGLDNLLSGAVENLYCAAISTRIETRHNYLIAVTNNLKELLKRKEKNDD